MRKSRYYFSTRDLLMMAALAALGGVTGTYVSAIGRMTQSFLGISGATQWAAGLHVLWLTLAVGLTGKQGAGTVTGILKGVVELLTGNPHGLVILLLDVIAGILVDVGFLPFRDKDRMSGYLVAGGLASFSNVLIIQLFAVLPIDLISYSGILLVGLVAGLSGVVFAGFLAYALMNTLRRTGVVKDRPPQPMHRTGYRIFLVTALLLAGALTLYLRGALRGPAAVHIGGAVDAPYDYPKQHGDLPTITAEGTQSGTTARYTGVPIRDLIAQAQPQADAGLLLAESSDGYAFFISMDEVLTSESLLLASQGKGSKATYDVVGAQNSKAWVRGVSTLTVIRTTTLEINGALEKPAPYDPDDWQFAMDSIPLDVGDGPRKVQGAPLADVLAALEPASDAATVILHTDGDPTSLPLDEVLNDNDVRIFTIIDGDQITFAVARMDGTVIAPHVTRIEVQ